MTVVWSRTYCVTSSAGRWPLLKLCPCQGNRFRSVEEHGNTRPALCGLTAGKYRDGVGPASAIAFDTLLVVPFRPRGNRDGGRLLIPTCKKLAMRLFCGGKKGFDHGRITAVCGCRRRLCADGIGDF